MKLFFMVACVLIGVAVNASAPITYLRKFTVAPGRGTEGVGILMQFSRNPVYMHCEQQVVTPRGSFIKSYIRGNATEGESCKWYIAAPENKIVRIILLSYNLGNEELPHPEKSEKPTVVSFFDSNRKLINQFFISPAEKFSRFSEFIQSKSISIEIEYHDIKAYSRQDVFVNYEILNAEDANDDYEGYVQYYD